MVAWCLRQAFHFSCLVKAVLLGKRNGQLIGCGWAHLVVVMFGGSNLRSSDVELSSEA
jgi:hypothetical protein